MTERLDAMDGYHALRWLVNEDADEQVSRSFAAGLDSLRAQQKHLQESLLRGFGSRREVVEWCHAVDVVSAGQTPSTWHSELIEDRWRVACFVADASLRDAIAPNAPERASTRKSVRRETIRETLLPAFRSATKLLRNRVGEFSDTDGVEGAERMEYIAGRPRLHQRAIEQHRLLRRTLREPPRTEAAVLDWAEDVIAATEGHAPETFVEDVLDRHGEWWFSLTNGPSVQLEWLLADDVFPAMNTLLSILAQDANEIADVAPQRREAPSG